MADTREKVNGKSPSDPQRGIGDNNPPPALTAKVKLARIEAIIERGDLTAAQKCIGVGIVVKANREGVAEARTQELMNFASVRDRETVFRATKILHEVEVLEKANKPGQTGRYNVLPPKVIDAIIAAHGAYQSGRAKPDGIGGGSGQLEPDGVGGGYAVRSEPTADETRLVQPVGPNPTPNAQDAPARACIVSPSGIVISQEKQQPTTTEQDPGGGSGLDFDAMNGVAVALTKFIGKYANVDQNVAHTMLSNNIKTFTAEAMMEAYAVTTAEMATTMIAKPYKYLIETARGIKAKGKSSDAKPAKGISRLKEKFLRAGE